MKTLSEYLELLDDRPEKFTEQEVNYLPVPEGSVMRCAGCLHYFRRNIDGFSVCEIMRSPRSDAEGVFPDWRCSFFTVDGGVFPLLDNSEPEETSDEEEEEPTE